MLHFQPEVRCLYVRIAQCSGDVRMLSQCVDRSFCPNYNKPTSLNFVIFASIRRILVRLDEWDTIININFTIVAGSPRCSRFIFVQNHLKQSNFIFCMSPPSYKGTHDSCSSLHKRHLTVDISACSAWLRHGVLGYLNFVSGNPNIDIYVHEIR